jgi:hypothetical protein
VSSSSSSPPSPASSPFSLAWFSSFPFSPSVSLDWVTSEESLDDEAGPRLRVGESGAGYSDEFAAKPARLSSIADFVLGVVLGWGLVSCE